MARTRGALGTYIISDDCDGCGLCVACAPDNVVRAWDGSHCRVAHQPANQREENALHDAEMGCPRACLRRDEAPVRRRGGSVRAT
jgi:ferredoxin